MYLLKLLRYFGKHTSLYIYLFTYVYLFTQSYINNLYVFDVILTVHRR